MNRILPSGDSGLSTALRFALMLFAFASCFIVLSIVTTVPGINALMWLVMLFSIIGPVWFDPNLRRQAFHPYSYFVLLGVFSFAVPGLLVWINRAAGTSLEYYPQAALLVAGSYIAFRLGYRSGVGVGLAHSVPLLVFPRAHKARLERRFWIPLLALYILGWFGRLTGSSIGMSHMPVDLGSLWRYASLFTDLGTFGTLSYLLMLYLTFRARWKPVQKGMLLGVLIGLEILAGALEGGRTAPVLAILYCLVAYHFAVRPVRWRTLVLGYALVFVFIGPLLTVYKDSYYKVMGLRQKSGLGAIVEALQLSGKSLDANEYDLGLLLEDITLRQGGSSFRSTLRVLERVPSVYDYELGRTLGEGLLAIVVPRILWPGKPLFIPGRDFAIRFWEKDVDQELGTSIGIGMPAEAYYNFGWFGLLIFPFLGVGLRFFTERFQRYERLETIYIVRAFFILFTVANLTNNFLYYFTALLRTALLILLFMVIVNGRLPKTKRWKGF